MDFARKQMEKYGWKDGEGLGKDGNQGITVAIKAKYKTGKEGMGFDISKDLVDTWWTRSYSDCLGRVSVNSDGDNVIVSTPCDDDGVEGDRPITKMRKRMLKANFTDFTKGAILSNGEMVEDDKDNEASAKLEAKTSFNLTDEELLKACGGRTAHKAARFGMKLSGKLARIASQEENNSLLPSDINIESLETKQKKLNKAKKRKENITIDDTIKISLELVNPATDYPKKKRKKSKIETSYDVEDSVSLIAHYPEDEQESVIDVVQKRKKSKKNKKKKQDICE